jgi:hypothetical protein
MAVSYRRSGTRGVNICYRVIPIKLGSVGLKPVKVHSNITGYPVCDNFLFKAAPLFGYN